MRTNTEIAIELTTLVLQNYSVPTWFFMVANDIFYNRLNLSDNSIAIRLAQLYGTEKIQANNIDIQSTKLVYCIKCGQEMYLDLNAMRKVCFACKQIENRKRALVAMRKNSR